MKMAIDNVYQKRPDLINQPFVVQLDAFFEEKISHAGGFIEAMNDIGNESYEIFYDCRIMQQTWAREKGLKYDEGQWQTDILLAQLMDIQPEVVYLQDIYAMPLGMRNILKELVPSIRIKAIQKGYPGERSDLSDADILFVSSPILYERYKYIQPYLVYHPFDDTILTRLRNYEVIGNDQNVEFSFVGSIRAPERRYWMLRELIKKTNIEIWGLEDKADYENRITTLSKMKGMLISAAKKGLVPLYGTHIPLSLKGQFIPKKLKKLILKIEESFKEQNREISYGIEIGKLPNNTLREMYISRCHKPLYGMDYYYLLFNSNIVFNMHSTAAKNTVDNMKMFEVTGVGSCLFTDTGTNMKDLFEEDKEVVTYRSVDEAVEKVSYLLDHPDEADQIAKAGQARTLRDHTVMNRCQQIDEVIQKLL